ncbi:hypothetical protein ARMSODRAFT_1021987 [Armillaria solidipes]|uniref:Uncharacterized protein n=1 Tax=Armillaria solidipes TaxID=1076256 RepID=A0A2H3BN24_9AGAR|nr:hypothetical protein ARMSODRAFT_1021987 [Armillaria solidipes]
MPSAFSSVYQLPPPPLTSTHCSPWVLVATTYIAGLLSRSPQPLRLVSQKSGLEVLGEVPPADCDPANFEKWFRQLAGHLDDELKKYKMEEWRSGMYELGDDCTISRDQPEYGPTKSTWTISYSTSITLLCSASTACLLPIISTESSRVIIMADDPTLTTCQFPHLNLPPSLPSKRQAFISPCYISILWSGIGQVGGDRS